MPNAEDEYSYDEFNSGFNESDLNDQDQSIEEFADIELSGYNEISGGLIPNAPRLKLNTGNKVVLRLLRFGTPPRSLSLIGKHLVYQLGVFGCPRVTDEALGGDKSVECPLCRIVKAGSFPRYLTPAVKHEIWAYALVLSIDRGSGWEPADLQSVIKPVRLRLEGLSGATLMRSLKSDPQLADLEHGTNLTVTAIAPDNWQLVLADKTPICLNTDRAKEKKQWQKINRLLGEPHMWVERNPKNMSSPQCSDPRPVDSEDRLTFAANYLKARYHAPEKSEDRFWTEMLNLSKPPLHQQYK